MTQRIRRFPEFNITLQIRDDDFINAPRDFQKNWMINRALDECADDLLHADKIVGRFVRGTDRNDQQAVPDDQKIMEDWQIPLMKSMAGIVTEGHGDILEIGFGRGIAATYVQEFGAHSHTIVECSDEIAKSFNKWKSDYEGNNIQFIHGKWQDVLDKLDMYDGILFHTNVNNQDEFIEYVLKSVTFAEHFFATAARYLRKGGIFTYLTHEIDSFSRRHQRALLQYFQSLTLSVLPLSLPEDCRDLWWADSMVVVKAVR